MKNSLRRAAALMRLASGLLTCRMPKYSSFAIGNAPTTILAVARCTGNPEDWAGRPQSLSSPAHSSPCVRAYVHTLGGGGIAGAFPDVTASTLTSRRPFAEYANILRKRGSQRAVPLNGCLREREWFPRLLQLVSLRSLETLRI